MLNYRRFRCCLPLLLLFLAAPLGAKIKVNLPDNFGTDEWAAANYKAAVNYLKYVAKSSQRESLLSAPDNLRMEAWDEFWKKLDPVSSSAENEFQKSYFARIRYADDNFGTQIQDGWLTDRGEAYVRMGPPDLIENFTMRAEGKDILVWNYHSYSEIYLVFLDRSLGNFYLLNPGDMIEEAFLRNPTSR